jgi:hypothetical protein
VTCVPRVFHLQPWMYIKYARRPACVHMTVAVSATAGAGKSLCRPAGGTAPSCGLRPLFFASQSTSTGTPTEGAVSRDPWGQADPHLLLLPASRDALAYLAAGRQGERLPATCRARLGASPRQPFRTAMRMDFRFFFWRGGLAAFSHWR